MVSYTACKYNILVAGEILIFKEVITQSVLKFWNWSISFFISKRWCVSNIPFFTSTLKNFVKKQKIDFILKKGNACNALCSNFNFSTCYKNSFTVWLFSALKSKLFTLWISHLSLKLNDTVTSMTSFLQASFWCLHQWASVLEYSK